MNGQIAPKGFRLRGTTLYLGIFVTLQGRYIIARRVLTPDGADFTYFTATNVNDFNDAWTNLEVVKFDDYLSIECNLGILFNQFNTLFRDDSQDDMPAPTGDPSADQTAMLGTLAKQATLNQVLASLQPLATEATLDALRQLVAGVLDVQVAALPLPAGAATAAGIDALGVLLTGIRNLLSGTLAISAAALPLPAGAATDAHVDAVGTTLTAILAKVSATQPVSLSTVPLAAGAATDAHVDALGAVLAQILTAVTSTVMVSAQSLPLPTGALSEAAYLSGVTSMGAVLTSIFNRLGTTLTVALPTGAATDAHVDALGTLLTAIKNLLSGTLAVTIASLPLPTGAATDARVDALGVTLGQILVKLSNTLAISATALPLPAGASTSALQTAGNTILSALQTALGTLVTNSPALVGGAVPVVFSGTIAASIAPKTSGGVANRVAVTSAASTTPTVVKNSPGQVYSIDASNESLSKRYLNLYNKATAPVASDIPVMTYCLFPGTALPHVDFGDLGAAFSNGIAFTISANNGIIGQLTSTLTVLLVAGEVTVNIGYA